jgi:DNA-binding PadR family transcriptional regulator
MEHMIFQLGLSVEAVSLYILLDHFEDSGKSITREILLTKWNASSDLLEQSLQELEMQGVVTISEQGVVAATPVSRWKAARES